LTVQEIMLHYSKHLGCFIATMDSQKCSGSWCIYTLCKADHRGDRQRNLQDEVCYKCTRDICI